jgi:hypothetical protein
VTNMISLVMYAIAVAGAVATYPSMIHAFFCGVIVAFGLALDGFVWWMRQDGAS